MVVSLKVAMRNAVMIGVPVVHVALCSMFWNDRGCTIDEMLFR